MTDKILLSNRPRNQQQTQRPPCLQAIVTCVVILILFGFLVPMCSQKKPRQYRISQINSQRQILLACNYFAADYAGSFPFGLEDDEASAESVSGKAKCSQDAFNDLVPDYLDSEWHFWLKTENPRQVRPNDNGKLEAGEVYLLYVTEQTTESLPDSPLVSDGEMTKTGEFTKFHPWLKDKVALVGFVGGHVVELPLTSKRTGATAMSEDRKIENIFKERANGGLLDTDAANILLPE